MQALREHGADPADARVAEAIARVREVRWDRSSGLPYFDGEAEACVDGVVLANGAYFGHDTTHVLAGLLETQLGDGGWNCETDTEVSSFHSTICVVEGLLAWESVASAGDPRIAEVRAARRRGEEYLLERRLLWRLSSGELIDPRFGMLSYPTRWYYDVGRALDHFRLARPGGDPRLDEAIAWLRAKADTAGRWRLENEHAGPVWFDMEWEGRPSRWVTLRSLRVLRWADGLS